MRKYMTIFGAIIFASFIFTSCGGGKSESDKTSADSTKTEVKVEKPKSDSKDAIKAISEKFYIPVDESKSDLIFTINQNLNFELVNYKGSFEGKYVDGKVQFDDKNSTIIDFSLKSENVILKNQNDVEVEFKVATENELIVGKWDNNFATAVFDKNGRWSQTTVYYTSHGTYKSIGNKKYNVFNWQNEAKNTVVSSMIDVNKINLAECGTLIRLKKGKSQSLNQIFN